MTLNFFRSFLGTSLTRPQQSSMRDMAPVHLLVNALKDYLRLRRDQQYLDSLPDYLLEDIGLSRADIKWHGCGPRVAASSRRGISLAHT